MVTAPVSPLGQHLYVKTRFATAVATPTTLGVCPTEHFQEATKEVFGVQCDLKRQIDLLD